MVCLFIKIEKVKNELAQYEVIPEDWGGDVQFVHVSAKSGEGVDALLDSILLQSEVLELKANADKLAYGHVVEAKIDTGRGPVATVLVQDGTLRNGDAVVCGIHFGKIRACWTTTGSRWNPPVLPYQSKSWVCPACLWPVMK